MKFWSRFWNSSKNPGKQRKFVYHAPLHVRHKLISVQLSKELKAKYGKRNIPVKKGDEVIITTGEFKKKTGKIRKVDLKKLKVYIDGITRKKVEGTDIQVPIDPSNLQIISLNLDDKKRVEKLGGKVIKNDTSKETKSTKILEDKQKGN